MSIDTSTTPPAATSAPGSDEAALRVLLARRVALFPALRRDDCPQSTIGEYMDLSGAITFIQARIGKARYQAVKAEVDRERPASVATASGGEVLR